LVLTDLPETIRGVWLMGHGDMDMLDIRQDKHIEQGMVKPIVAKSFSLEEICDAQTMFLKKQHVGKIVLKI
jgi:NADPH:quinone reductase-like Zn-dependent oxidoreductase